MEFGLQLSVKLGDDMINVRGTTGAEFAANLAAAEQYIAQMKAFRDALRNAPPAVVQTAVTAAPAQPAIASPAQPEVPVTFAQAFQNLQQAGLNPQVVQPQVVPQPQFDPAQQAYAQPPQQYAQPAPPPIAAGAACLACNKTPACKVCGGPTHLTVVGRDKKYNAHQCLANCEKGAVWCKTPIPAALAPSLGNPGLVYG